MNTKEQIIFEATKMFLSKGYETTSLADIVEKCGVTKGAFYHHFKSKDELFQEILNTMFSELENWINAMLLEKKTFKEFLYAYFDYISFFKNMSLEMGISMNMYDLIFDASKKFPNFKKMISQTYKKFFNQIKSRIDSAIKNGEILDNVDSESFAVHLTVLIEGFILFEVLLEDENMMFEHSRKIADDIWLRIKK